MPLAVLIVYSPALKNALYPLIVLAQSVPKIAIAPVLLLVVGHGEFPKIIVAFLVAFFPVVVDTATGLAATPPELLDLSRSYRASAFKTFLKVRLPMALPFFFAGAKVAITLSVIGAVVGEFVGSDQGLGYVILSATSYWKTELAFSSMILLSVMAIVLFGAVSLVERLACPWLAPAGPRNEETTMKTLIHGRRRRRLSRGRPPAPARRRPRLRGRPHRLRRPRLRRPGRSSASTPPASS